MPSVLFRPRVITAIVVLILVQLISFTVWYFWNQPRARKKSVRTATASTQFDQAEVGPFLKDHYHGLYVGPCGDEDRAAWIEHPWCNASAGVTADFDCDYATWVAEFSGSLPTEPFTPVLPGTNAEVELPNGVSVELRDGAWVVRDGKSLWIAILENGWIMDYELGPNDTQPLRFESESDAKEAYLQANQMTSDRAVRQRDAREKIKELKLRGN